MHTSLGLLILPLAITAACSPAEPQLRAQDGWAAESGGDVGAAYLTVVNRGGGEDRLVAVRTERGHASLHRTEIDNGVARMIAVPTSEGLEIEAGGELRLAPGGAHVMLSGLDAPLKAGDRFNLTLHFQRSRPQTLAIAVRPAEAQHGGH